MNEEIIPHKSQHNPVERLWTILGNIGGVLALANMASTWKNDLISWAGFLNSVFSTYRAIINPISYVLFGWMPFNMYSWFGDYFLFGTILIASMFRSNQIESIKTFEPRADDNIVHIAEPEKPVPWILYPVIFILLVLIWPYIVSSNAIAVVVISCVPSNKRTAHMQIDRHEYLRTLQWMAAICLGSVILISLNEVIY